MLLKFFISIFFLLFSHSALAQFEEYGYFSESETDEVNTPLLIDSEYFSDMLTYRLPLSMHSTFLRSERVYDLTIGSLSRTRFATQHRLKLDSHLSDTLIFRLAYFEKKDLEQSINHFILELQYKLNSFMSVVGYTELKSEKKWNDVGSALLLHMNPDHTLRLYTTWIDFSFNKRNEDNQSDSRRPVAYGFVGRILNPNTTTSFLEYYGQVQTPLNRQQNSITNYIYKNSKIGFRGTQLFYSEDQFLHFDASTTYRAEGVQQSGSTDSAFGLWRSHHIDVLLQYENSKWIYGLSSALRKWEIHSQNVDAQIFSPHIWYKHISQSLGKEDLRFGYEASFHTINGPSELRSPDNINNNLEHRGNMRYTIYFNDSAFLHLQLTADLDDFSWEGGNGTFQILF